jgi:hypothetical protein
VFNIRAGSEADYSPAREASFQNPPQTRLISNSGNAPCGRRSQIAVATKIEARGPGLTHALHLQAEHGPLYFRIKNSAYNVALV